MYVRNRIGFNFAFKYKGVVIKIPFDGKIYSIPNDCPKFKELQEIRPMHIKTREVLYVKNNGEISDGLGGHKRRGRPPKVEKPKKPSTDKGRPAKKYFPRKKRKQVIPESENAVVNINLDDLCIDTSATNITEESTPKKRGRPRKEKTPEELNKPKKPRGRPRKPKTEEQLNKPKNPRGRPRKKSTEE